MQGAHHSNTLVRLYLCSCEDVLVLQIRLGKKLYWYYCPLWNGLVMRHIEAAASEDNCVSSPSYTVSHVPSWYFSCALSYSQSSVTVPIRWGDCHLSLSLRWQNILGELLALPIIWIFSQWLLTSVMQGTTFHMNSNTHVKQDPLCESHPLMIFHFYVFLTGFFPLNFNTFSDIVLSMQAGFPIYLTTAKGI